ncbi:hypothetical protein TNCV_972301 [Trichonephila clavipes]|nr:hypothetical protein TNCV_972301 [Trichonephila clavipes]
MERMSAVVFVFPPYPADFLWVQIHALQWPRKVLEVRLMLRESILNTSGTMHSCIISSMKYPSPSGSTETTSITLLENCARTSGTSSRRGQLVHIKLLKTFDGASVEKPMRFVVFEIEVLQQ